MKIVLAGPPRSGKSCLRWGLKKAVLRESESRTDMYPITAAPDGEGAWFHETYERSAEEAIALRDQYKYPITPEYAQRLAKNVADCDAPLTAIDVGGRVSDENRLICAAATHAILIAGDHPQHGGWNERLAEWRDFCRELGLTLLAELHSDYDAAADEIQGVDSQGVLRARVHHLERGDRIEDRPAVIALAKHVLARFMSGHGRQETHS
jgi:CRISPR-associated protein Csx3